MVECWFQTNKQLKLYSGTFRMTVSNASCMGLCDSQETEIDTFWKIIMDEKDYAVIVVTQYTLKKCNKNSYICEENRATEQKYASKKGGCIYTCSVNKDVINRLGLPELNIVGVLSLTFPQKISTQTTQLSLHGQQPPAEKPSKVFGIRDFMKKGKFMRTLDDADADLSAKVKVHGSTGSSKENCDGKGSVGCFGGGTETDNVQDRFEGGRLE